MKAKGFICIIVAFFMLTACATNSVRTDYDLKVDFSQFQHFVMTPIKKTDDALLDNRLSQQIQQQLIVQGFQLDPNQADFQVTFSSKQLDKLSSNRVSVGIGTSRRIGSSGHLSTNINNQGLQQRQYQSIDIQIFSNQQLVWRGSDDFKLSKNVDKNHQASAKTIAKILQSFPPM